MSKKEIKQIFSNEGIQMGAGTIGLVQVELRKRVRQMARRTKEGNVKRLTTKLFWVALGNWARGESHIDK